MSPVWSAVASEDLRAIGDSIVAAEVFHIAEKELRPNQDDALEGALIDYPLVRFRRCVRVASISSYLSYEIDESDHFGHDAHDYLVLYRDLTRDEQINLKRVPGLVIVRIVSNNRLARHVRATFK